MMGGCRGRDARRFFLRGRGETMGTTGGTSGFGAILAQVLSGFVEFLVTFLSTFIPAVIQLFGPGSTLGVTGGS